MWYYCNVCCWVVTIRNRQTSVWSTSRIFRVRCTTAAQSGGIRWHLTITIQIYYTSPVLDGRRQWQPTPVLLPGKYHGWRSLVGCSPWGRQESDNAEWLHFHFSLSCIGEGHATHSRVLAWRIPGMGEPGGLPPGSWVSLKVGHDWSDLAAAAAAQFWILPSMSSSLNPTPPKICIEK